MAKGNTNKPTGTSRIRFVMVEAEIADGEISQITQAIQNALKSAPAHSSPQRLVSSGNVKQTGRDAEEDFEAEIDDVEVEEVQPESRPVRQRSVRKPAATPDVLELDMLTSVSLAEFVEPTKPKSHNQRFLLISFWFKEYRGLDSVTPSHIYTGYRTLKWPLGIQDFAQPLRNLKAAQLMTTPEKGQYSINHLGIAEVQKMLTGTE